MIAFLRKRYRISSRKVHAQDILPLSCAIVFILKPGRRGGGGGMVSVAKVKDIGGGEENVATLGGNSHWSLPCHIYRVSVSDDKSCQRARPDSRTQKFRFRLFQKKLFSRCNRTKGKEEKKRNENELSIHNSGLRNQIMSVFLERGFTSVGLTLAVALVYLCSRSMDPTDVTHDLTRLNVKRKIAKKKS